MDRISLIQRSRNISNIHSKDKTPDMVVRQLEFFSGYRYGLHIPCLYDMSDLVFTRLYRLVVCSVAS